VAALYKDVLANTENSIDSLKNLEDEVRERTGVDVLITSFCQFSAKKLL
jgi:hypothetical protein